MANFKLDDRVKVIGKNEKGRIAFIGKIHSMEGIMYGVALDKPKGRCSGQIGDVSYFSCPKDHGVFVRVCQLEMDNGNLSHYSDNYNGDVIPRPVYPNYLKSSSKGNFRNSKYRSKSKVSKVKSPLKQIVRSKQLSGNYQCLEVSKDHGLQVKKRRHLSSKRDLKRTSDKENFLVAQIETHTQQIDTIRRYLKKLKTYIRWCKGFDSNQNQLKVLLDNSIDSVIRNMMEIVGTSEKGNNYDYDYSKGDIGLEQENGILLQCIWDLEKKNETLLACMTKIRDFLLNSWKRRSSSKSKSNVDRKETSERLCASENDYENCSPENPETQSASKLSLKNQSHLEKILQKEDTAEGETETTQLNHKSINFGAKTDSQEASTSSLHSKNENGLNDNPKTDAQHLSKDECDRNYLEPVNNDGKKLNKELREIGGEKSNDKCVDEVSNKKKSTMENKQSPILKEKKMSSPSNEKVLHSLKPNLKTKHKTKRHQSKIRYQPYVSNKKLNTEQNASNIDTDITEDEKDPTKELGELISNIMANMNLNEQNEMAQKDSTKELSELISNITTNMSPKEPNEMAPKDSSKFTELNMDRPATSVVTGKSYSDNPDSDKFEKVSTPSNKTKSENILKSWKPVRGGNTCRSKSPKRRVHLKQTMEVRKQPTLYR